MHDRYLFIPRDSNKFHETFYLTLSHVSNLYSTYMPTSTMRPKYSYLYSCSCSCSFLVIKYYIIIIVIIIIILSNEGPE